MRTAALALVLVLGACGTPTPLSMIDGGPRPLVCATPQRIDLVAPTTGTNTGVPMAAIAWPGDRCVLSVDEHAPGLVLLIADFTGSVFSAASVIASAGSRWAIDGSTSGSGSTYLTNLPRDTDITVTMHDTDAQVSVTFRLESNTLVLLDMHRI